LSDLSRRKEQNKYKNNTNSNKIVAFQNIIANLRRKYILQAAKTRNSQNTFNAETERVFCLAKSNKPLLKRTGMKYSSFSGAHILKRSFSTKINNTNSEEKKI
jgi:hypothetical protein